MPELLVQTDDGQTVPLKRCFWVRFNGDGCVVGSLLGELALDAEQAHREFTRRQRQRDRETRQGYRHELLTHEQWKAHAEPCLLGRCEHRTAAKGDAR